MTPLAVRYAPPDSGRRMRVIATAMLAAMAAVFIAVSGLEDAHPAWGFVKAFAEAAMVGGIADWFAVTALFRHPLGLPIPHTAIIPRNKDRIGDQLALFLRDNFLTPSVVARRMQRVDVAGAAGRFLAEPPQQGRLWRGAARMLESMLEALDPERFGTMVKGVLADRLRSFDAAPLIGEALDAAIAEDRHVPLLDELVIAIARLVNNNEDLIRQMVHDRSGSILRWTGLDSTVADKIIDGIDRLLTELAADPAHPLRKKIEEQLRDLAEKLRTDPEMRQRVMDLKSGLLDNPAVEQWWLGVWERMRTGLIARVRDPEGALAGEVGVMLRELGEALEHNVRFRRGINRFARRAIVGVAADYGDGIVRLVSDTVKKWDAGTITARLESAVGKDLQYIRINGTVVGGLVGLVIHTIEVAL
ncbi:MAG TPA: DUF445 domain-containing protein [Allosphingosinicella sp.]